jgi:hypothetical protein
LYSCPYLNQQKPFVLLIIAYTLSSTKLEIRTEQFLPGSEWVGGKRRRWGVKGGSRKKGEEMTQTLYAHKNKRNKKKEKRVRKLNNLAQISHYLKNHKLCVTKH